MNLVSTGSSTATDPVCHYCGRPVVGTSVWGVAGPYHPECCSGTVSPEGGHLGSRELTPIEYEQRGQIYRLEQKLRDARAEAARLRDIVGRALPWIERTYGAIENCKDPLVNDMREALAAVRDNKEESK